LKKTLKIAVRDLVAHVLRSGDLSFEFLASTRPVDAIRIHQKIQQSRPENYSAEVTVSHLIETDLCQLTISGRVDGIYRDAGGALIEEIKTTTRSLDDFEDRADPIHWGQVKAYAYMVALDQELSALDAQLTYYQVDTAEIRSFKKHFRLSELETFFQDLVDNYLQWATTVVNWEILRDESIARLEFPFGAYRPGQREMAIGVYRTIKHNGQQLIQAATGIGKTMAALFPAVKALGEDLTSKIFFLTARTTGRFAAEYALDELRSAGLKLKSLTITAKDKTCFNPKVPAAPKNVNLHAGIMTGSMAP